MRRLICFSEELWILVYSKRNLWSDNLDAPTDLFLRGALDSYLFQAKSLKSDSMDAPTDLFLRGALDSCLFQVKSLVRQP